MKMLSEKLLRVTKSELDYETAEEIALQIVIAWMADRELSVIPVQDDSRVISCARISGVDDEDLDLGIAWLPRDVFENSTPEGGWNPVVRLSALRARAGLPELVTLEDIDAFAGQGQPFADNPARAHRGASAISAYVKVVGRDIPESAIGDLIADLLHLARAVDGVDPEEVLESAVRHFRAEAGE